MAVINPVLLVLSCAVISVQASCHETGQPVANLREVVIGACEMYQFRVNPSVFCREGYRNCTDIWEQFHAGFRFQESCNVSSQTYEPYIQATKHSIPPHTSLFWANVYPFVHRFSNQGAKYTTLSDTLTGYIGNGKHWCSDPDASDGIAAPDTTCDGIDDSNSCPMSAESAFWTACSRYFGNSASGEVHIMFNTTTDPIYDDKSYFASFELPYLSADRVTKATVLLINENPSPDSTKCDDPSLQRLKKSLDKKHIEYFCIENRRDLVTLFCLDYPGAAVCPTLDNYTGSASSLTSNIVLTTLMWISTFI